MVFDELSKYKKIQDPEPRKPKDIEHNTNSEAKYTKPSIGKTVSMATARRTSTFITLSIWLGFIAGVAFLLYYVLGAYTN